MSRTPSAMQQLLTTIHTNIPFDQLDEARVCSGQCIGCPKKLLEYLEQEVQWWQQSLDAGEVPKLGDIEKLSRSSQKIYRVLQKNQIL
ncbi:hypothetical protein FME95_10900 [Reinekea thalattae]|uniref:Uncharacterized protein n=2 Tax=Reinekea thalattae TaxID=2593301 RepID=A0A5C8Z4N7_9GAMM|nr:hypothetical protein FME95_10900 [Reinekea thalattae]